MNEIREPVRIYTEAQYLAHSDPRESCVILYPYGSRDLNFPRRYGTAAMVIGLAGGVQVYHRIFEPGTKPYSPVNWRYLPTPSDDPTASNVFEAVEEALHHVVAAKSAMTMEAQG